MEDLMKAETDQVFKVLKVRKENKVRNPNTAATRKIANDASRLTLTAKLATRHGLRSRLACITVSIVPTCNVIWACIPRLFGTSLLRCLKVRPAASEHLFTNSTNLDSRQLTQLHPLKVGSNGSAIKFCSTRLRIDSDTKKKYMSCSKKCSPAA